MAEEVLRRRSGNYSRGGGGSMGGMDPEMLAMMQAMSEAAGGGGGGMGGSMGGRERPEMDPLAIADAKAEIQNLVEQRQLLQQKFEEIDTDGNEDLEEDEFVEGMQNIGVRLSEAEIKEVFDFMDFEKEGSVDVIMFVQFFTQPWSSAHLQYLQKSVLDCVRPARHRRGETHLFGGADDEDDIDPFEMAEAQKAMQAAITGMLDTETQKKTHEEMLIHDMEEAQEHSDIDHWCNKDRADEWTRFEVAWYLREKDLEDYLMKFLEGNIDGKTFLYDMNEFTMTQIGVKPLNFGRLTRLSEELRVHCMKELDQSIIFGVHYIPDASENANVIISNLKQELSDASDELKKISEEFENKIDGLTAELSVARETIEAARADGFVFSDESESETDAAFDAILMEREDTLKQAAAVAAAAEEQSGLANASSDTISVTVSGDPFDGGSLSVPGTSDYSIDVGDGDPSERVRSATTVFMDNELAPAFAPTPRASDDDGDSGAPVVDSTALSTAVSTEPDEATIEASLAFAEAAAAGGSDDDLLVITQTASRPDQPLAADAASGATDQSSSKLHKKTPSLVVKSKKHHHRKRSTLGGRSKAPPLGTKAWWLWLSNRAEESKSFGREEFVDQWTPEEIAFWLRRVGFENYAPKFVENKVNAEVLFNDITYDVLREDLGVKQLHCGRILRRIKELKTKGWKTLIKSEYMNTLIIPPPSERASYKIDELTQMLNDKEQEFGQAKEEWQIEMDTLKEEVVKLEEALEAAKKRKPKSDDEDEDGDGFAKMLLLASDPDAGLTGSPLPDGLSPSPAPSGSGLTPVGGGAGEIDSKEDESVAIPVPEPSVEPPPPSAEVLDHSEDGNESSADDGDAQAATADDPSPDGADAAANPDEEVKSSEDVIAEAPTPANEAAGMEDGDTVAELVKKEEKKPQLSDRKTKRAPKEPRVFDAREIARIKAKLAPLNKTMKHFMIEVTKRARSKADTYARANSAKTWKFDEVCYWLSEIDFVQYIPKFAEHKIDGEIVIVDLNEKILHEDLEVPRFHSGKIMREIRKLKLMCRQVYNVSEYNQVSFIPDFSASLRLKELDELVKQLTQELSESQTKIDELLSKPQINEDEKIIKISEYEKMLETCNTLEKQCDDLESQLEEVKAQALPEKELEEQRIKTDEYIESLKMMYEESSAMLITEDENILPLFANPNRLKEWTTDEVCYWFFINGYNEYVYHLKESSVNGEQLAKDVSPEWLMSREIGVKRVDVSKILRDLKNLKLIAFKDLIDPSIFFICEHSFLPKDGESAKERFAAYELNVQSLNKERDELIERCTELTSQLNDAQTQCNEFREREEQAIVNLDEFKKNVEIEKAQMIETYDNKVDELNNKLQSVTEELSSVSTLLSEKSDLVDELTMEVDRLSKEEQANQEEIAYFDALEKKAQSDICFCNPSRTLKWTLEEVSLWLYKIRSKEYVDAFREARVDGSVLLNDLTTDTMEEDLAVKKHHIPKIVREIAKLRDVAWPTLVECDEPLDFKYQPSEEEKQRMSDYQESAENEAAINQALRMELDKLREEVEMRRRQDGDAGVPPPPQEFARSTTEEMKMADSESGLGKGLSSSAAGAAGSSSSLSDGDHSADYKKLVQKVDELEEEIARVEQSKLRLVRAMGEQMEHMRATIKVLLSDFETVTETPFGPDPRKAVLSYFGLEVRSDDASRGRRGRR